ncbi:inner membrane-spanning protein YciB [Thorsellia kenyensis]|uniref:Inner membrane-spanning protein YciB n=1 Tax=Thorsellia kenyensis TaxID=1549888 RepID=A0ABV6C7J1_9GAMM
MNAILKFLPVIIFFVIYKKYDIFLATKALIGLTVLSTVIYYFLYKRIDKMMLFSNILLVIFGLLTIKFQNESFLIWKVTIIYWILAIGLVITTFVTKKSAMEVAMKDELTAPKHVWRNINIALIIFLIFCSGLNLFVGWHYDLDTWVNFKMFGMPVLLVVFLVLQMVYLFKNAKMIEKNENTSLQTDIDSQMQNSSDKTTDTQK